MTDGRGGVAGTTARQSAASAVHVCSIGRVVAQTYQFSVSLRAQTWTAASEPEPGLLHAPAADIPRVHFTHFSQELTHNSSRFQASHHPLWMSLLQILIIAARSNMPHLLRRIQFLRVQDLSFGGSLRASATVRIQNQSLDTTLKAAAQRPSLETLATAKTHTRLTAQSANGGRLAGDSRCPNSVVLI